MNGDVEARLAKSLTADSTDLIPYLPYLLQDFWSLASDAAEMAQLLRVQTDFGTDCRLLDLACGKGAASVMLAKEFGCTAKGVDLIAAFVEEAAEKATAHGVAAQCTFAVGDVNEAVLIEKDYDLTIWCGAGDLLGSYAETLAGIARTVKPGGYILLDEGYVKEEAALRFQQDYLTEAEWDGVFCAQGLTVIACSKAENECDPSEYAEDLDNIRRRAQELIARHPEKRDMFEQYVRNQQGEYADLQDGIVAALWLLRKSPAK